MGEVCPDVKTIAKKGETEKKYKKKTKKRQGIENKTKKRIEKTIFMR